MSDFDICGIYTKPFLSSAISLFVVCVSKKSGAEQAETVLKMETIPLHSSGPKLHTWQGCIDKQLRTSSLVGFATETSGVELGQVS